MLIHIAIAGAYARQWPDAAWDGYMRRIGLWTHRLLSRPASRASSRPVSRAGMGVGMGMEMDVDDDSAARGSGTRASDADLDPTYLFHNVCWCWAPWVANCLAMLSALFSGSTLCMPPIFVLMSTNRKERTHCGLCIFNDLFPYRPIGKEGWEGVPCAARASDDADDVIVKLLADGQQRRAYRVAQR
jgi:hypothetical protein